MMRRPVSHLNLVTHPSDDARAEMVNPGQERARVPRSFGRVGQLQQAEGGNSQDHQADDGDTHLS
jgi:hypothetical protein